ETGTSTWDAIGQAIRRRLLPQRALTALENFQRIINDAHALLEPGFAEKLAADVAVAAEEVLPEGGYTQGPNSEDDAEDDTEEEGTLDDGTGFAFGAQGMLDLTHDGPADDSFLPEAFGEAAIDEETPADVTFNPFDDVALKQSGSSFTTAEETVASESSEEERA